MRRHGTTRPRYAYSLIAFGIEIPTDSLAQIQDEIQKLKYKEPESTKLVTLEQELVRAEAQSLVAEAQLTNITRQKFKEAYDVHTAAIIERAEKQIILAKQARRLIELLDDTPIVPGEERVPFADGDEAREVLNDAESGLKHWTPTVEPIKFYSEGKLGANAMPGNTDSVEQPSHDTLTTAQRRVEERERAEAEEDAGVTTASPVVEKTVVAETA